MRGLDPEAGVPAGPISIPGRFGHSPSQSESADASEVPDCATSPLFPQGLAGDATECFPTSRGAPAPGSPTLASHLSALNFSTPQDREVLEGL